MVCVTKISIPFRGDLFPAIPLSSSGNFKAPLSKDPVLNDFDILSSVAGALNTDEGRSKDGTGYKWSQ